MMRRIAIGTFAAVISVRSAAGQTPRHIDFEKDVAPLIQQHCLGCHGPEQQMSAFRLDRKSWALRGGRDPNDIVPGSSATSHLYARLLGGGRFAQMPPTGRLSDDVIATFKAWLDEGALWPEAFANEPVITPPDPKATQLMAMIREGDVRAALQMLEREPDVVNRRGPGGATPLMYAALYSDTATMQAILAHGADPNARNDAGATALMWAVADAGKIRLLVDRGADVNARSDEGRTALAIAAAQRTPLAVLQVLLDRGARPNDATRSGDFSTLALAARTANVDAMALLIDRGAKEPGAGAVYWAFLTTCDSCIDLALKVISKQGLDAALSQMVRRDDPAAVRLLLERGADANARDARGNTALIGAAASEFVRPDTVALLLSHGAEVNATNRDGRTALSFALDRGETPVVAALRKAGAEARGSAPATYGPSTAPRPVPAHSIQEAVQRSLPLLQKTDVIFLQNTGCVSCHHNSLTAMAVATARKNGFTVDERIAERQLKLIAARQADWRERALQGMVLADTPFVVGYTLMGMHAEQYPADATTDAMTIFLLNNQLPDGHWRLGAHRPPIEFTELTATATAVRALGLYTPKSHTHAAALAIRAAQDWLIHAPARTSEERNMRLMGLVWSGADKQTVATTMRAIAAEQQPDGGWSQLQWLPTDAYGTGQTLVALHEAGMAVSDPVYQRGVRFLLTRQMIDGSWWVKTRSIPTQIPFDSGFPHGVDQWISAAATNWSTIALAISASSQTQKRPSSEASRR